MHRPQRVRPAMASAVVAALAFGLVLAACGDSIADTETRHGLR